MQTKFLNGHLHSDKVINEMVEKIIKQLSSTRLTIFLFVILIPLLILGGVIPQNYPSAYYHYNFGKFSIILEILGITHIFSSKMFLLVMTLFLLNLLACLYRRIPQKIRVHRQKKILTPSQVNQLRIKTHLPEESIEEVIKKFKDKGYKVVVQKGDAWFLRKGLSGWWGVEVVHLGLLLIFLAGIITATCSKSYFFQILPGEKKEIENNLFIKLVDFEIPLYPDGTPSQYISTIELLRGRHLVDKATIKVNSPLRFKGYWIYQSSYGIAPFSIKSARLKFYMEGVTEVVTVPFRKNVSLILKNGYPLEISCPVFIPDFEFDIQTQRVLTRSLEHNNPALLCKFSLSGRKIIRWLFLNFPQFSHSNEHFKVELLSYTPVYFSGIEVNRDPGDTLFIMGGILIFSGLLIILYFPFQRIWIVKTENGFVAGGISYRGERKLKKEFEEISGEKNEMV